MRFGIIYYGTEAKNRGLDQLAQGLIAIGHKPYIVTRKPRNGVAISEFNGVRVIQLPAKQKHFDSFLTTPFPFNPVWNASIIALAKKYKWDGLFIRETPLSWAGIKAGLHLGIPAFLDIRENLGASYEFNNQTQRSFLKRLRRRNFVRLYEKFVLPKFNHIFSSTDELRQWIVGDYGVRSEKLSVLGNYPSKVFLDQADEAFGNKKRANGGNFLRLVHAGYVLENRGLQDVIRALGIIRKRSSDFSFRIIGDGPYLGELMKFVKEANIEENIAFVSMLSPDDVAGALSDCDIGICSYLLNEQTHQTLPGKLFEYMAVGLPILASARRPVVRIVEETECGVIYKSRNPEVIGKLVLELAGNKEKRIRMGRNGRKAVLKKYNWRSNLDALNRILSRYESRKQFKRSY